MIPVIVRRIEGRCLRHPREPPICLLYWQRLTLFVINSELLKFHILFLECYPSLSVYSKLPLKSWQHHTNDNRNSSDVVLWYGMSEIVNVGVGWRDVTCVSGRHKVLWRVYMETLYILYTLWWYKLYTAAHCSHFTQQSIGLFIKTCYLYSGYSFSECDQRAGRPLQPIFLSPPV